ncbi:Uncharacterised protein [uncultured archaeon]|nr:Uncharacterised protein [uncultured archaeon]
MSRLFYQILPLIVLAGSAMISLEKMLDISPAKVTPFSVRYNRTAPETDYVYRNLLPQNTPRGSNIGVCNFKRI